MVYQTTLKYSPSPSDEKEDVSVPVFSFDFEWEPPHCRLKANKIKKNREAKSDIEILEEILNKKRMTFEPYLRPEMPPKPIWFYHYYRVNGLMFYELGELGENIFSHILLNVSAAYLISSLLLPILFVIATFIFGTAALDSLSMGFVWFLVLAPPVFLAIGLPVLIGTVLYFVARHRWNQQKESYDSQQDSKTITVNIQKIEDLDRLLSDIVSNQQTEDILKACFLDSDNESRKIEYSWYKKKHESGMEQAFKIRNTALIKHFMDDLEKTADSTEDLDEKDRMVQLLVKCLDDMNNPKFLSEQKTVFEYPGQEFKINPLTAHALFIKRGDLIFKYGLYNPGQCLIALADYQKALEALGKGAASLSAEEKDRLMQEIYEKQYAIYDYLFSSTTEPNMSGSDSCIVGESKEEGSLDDAEASSVLGSVEMDNIANQLAQTKQFFDVLNKLIGFEQSIVDCYQGDPKAAAAKKNIEMYERRREIAETRIKELKQGITKHGEELKKDTYGNPLFKNTTKEQASSNTIKNKKNSNRLD